MGMGRRSVLYCKKLETRELEAPNVKIDVHQTTPVFCEIQQSLCEFEFVSGSLGIDEER